ncbi:MAG: hypothetical protein GQ525_04960, partial [Draconibacterium sp.]|nr:hypothetical protein [Draconibacterium sp.]
MKANSIILTILFVSLFLCSFSQEQPIKLRMEKGYEYVFEKIDKGYLIGKDESESMYLTDTKVVRLIVEKNVPNKKVHIALSFIENFKDGNARKGAINRTDHFFPEFKDGDYSFNYNESLFSRSIFHFTVNLETNEIDLVNRVELLEAFYIRLREQGYDTKEIKGLISLINKKELLIENDLISFLTWFQNAKITVEKTVKSNWADDKFIVRERQGNFINFGDQEFKKIISGKEFKKYWINLENGIITNYSTIQYDSIKSKHVNYLNQNIWRVKETNFRLLYSQKIPQNKLFISGKIENPLSDKVHIKILDKPFGYTLKTKTVILDENGTFNTSLDYFHEGFVYVENENRNKHNPPGTYVFYAEPGDTIEFESSGTELPWNTTILGSRATENKYIQEIRKEIKINEAINASSWGKVILDRDIIFRVFVINGKPQSIGKIDPLFRGIDLVEQISTKYKTEIPEKAFNFITNEFNAYLYSGILNFVWSRNLNYDIRLEESLDSIDFLLLLKKIDMLDIHDVYNDYGLYSRKCASQYLSYHFSKTNRTKSRNLTGFGIRNSSDTELEVQFSKMVLTGSPLYREIAQILSKKIISKTSRNNIKADSYI